MSAKKKVNYWQMPILIILLIVILLPIFLYQHQFGNSFSDKQVDWGDFGSYISGIYAPIFSFLTLFLLYSQNKTQEKMNKYQREYNDATRLRANAEFYLNSLDMSLAPGTTSDDKVIKPLELFRAISSQNLENKDLQNSANLIHMQNQKILTAWAGFNNSLSSLKVYLDTSFEQHYQSVRLLPIHIFGFDYCAALDNYCYIQSRGKLIFNEYSNVIPK